MVSIRPDQDYRSGSQDRLKEDIVTYYDECYWDYRTSWLDNRNLAIHYGYWDKTIRKHSDSLLNMNRVLARKAEIKPGDRVLDAGCGIGGSAIWLAEQCGATVTGITLSESQVKMATQNARRRGVSDKVSFEVADFCETGFHDAAFDVVWGIESVCHALDKKSFIREASRVLAPGGRLVTADGYALKTEYSESEWEIVRTCLDGWEIPNLATPEYFREALSANGFKSIDFTDATVNTLPSARRLYRTALLTYPMQKMMVWLKLRTSSQSGNFYTALNQYKIFHEGMACYGIFLAKK